VARETQARGVCHCCGGPVAVKLNVAEKVYYNCDNCGVKVQHTWQRSSDAYMHQLAPKAAPSPAPSAPAPSPSPSPAPAPAAKPRGAGTVLG
jgi:hypothetical protein